MIQPMTSIKHPKFASLTALAAACTLIFSAPALAATSDSAPISETTPASETAEAEAPTAADDSAPSAIDSSRRIIRRAQPSASANSTSTATSSTQAASNALPMVATPSLNEDQQAPVQNASNQSPTTESSTTESLTTENTVPTAPTAYTPTVPVAPKPTGETLVFQRGPITSTGIDISTGQLSNIPVPQAQITDISFVPTTLIPQTTNGIDQLDVSLLDDFIEDVSPNVRHYPPNFPNRTQRHNTREKIKAFVEWIEPYASEPDATYDVLIRAAKLNGMGRNLDLGSEYAVRASQHVDRAIKAQPDSAEANFLYGMMLAEGGGFKEGQKYLEKAVSLGYTEAEQSLAQSDLLSDRRNEALERLRRLQQQMPNNQIIPQQIKLIEDGEYYIWDLPAPNIDVKPIKTTT